MWNRKKLKERAKAAFMRNYWKCVAVALILALLTGAATAFSTSGVRTQTNLNINNTSMTQEEAAAQITEAIQQAFINSGMTEEEFAEVLLVALLLIVGILIIAAFIHCLLDIFLWNIFEIGGCRFFAHNSFENAQVKEVLYGFSNGYIKNVGALFLRGFYLFCWSLLFIFPAIIKSYSYMLVPYLLAESPEMTSKAAFRISRQIMDGNKWRAFVLDLSFIGWNILSALTFGILGIFFVKPYIHAAHAELYRTLRYPETIRQYED